MAAIPLKPGYGPTLGGLLAPRWHAASATARGLVLGAAVCLVALTVSGVLTLQSAAISHSGAVSFNFHYRGLYRAAPDPGGYARVVRRQGVQIVDSFAVDPLHLPAYQGTLGGYLPMYASGYIQSLRRRYADFQLQGEGKTRVNGVPAYAINFSTRTDGRPVDGRAVLIAPDQVGVRYGVVLVLLTPASKLITAALGVGAAGVLQLPLRSFYFGA